LCSLQSLHSRGWFLDGKNKELHVASGECKPTLFASRMKPVAKFEAEGKDPNALLRK
jgi:hypothetical protein